MVSGVGEALAPCLSSGYGVLPKRQVGGWRKVSTLRVAAAAIARNHKVAGFDVTFRHGTARAALDKLTREEVPSGRLRRRQERHKARLFGA